MVLTINIIYAGFKFFIVIANNTMMAIKYMKADLTNNNKNNITTAIEKIYL